MDRLRKKLGNRYKGRSQKEQIAIPGEVIPDIPSGKAPSLSGQGPRDAVAGAQETDSSQVGTKQDEENEPHGANNRSASTGLLGNELQHSNTRVASAPSIELECRRSSKLSVSLSPPSSERRQGSFQSMTSISVSPNLLNGARMRSPSEHRRVNPLGLTVIHEPEDGHSFDIVLVHGLGGSSHSTWSKDHDPNYFWPHLWLPSEPTIGSARISSFGYDADWKSTSSRNVLNITDFAKELLFAMRYTKDEKRDLEDLGIGDVPIIFIVHSMGGLVVKKAYILAQNDDEYAGMVKEVKAIIFLSTPHRGSNLAELLNRILSVSLFRYSPKQYVADLQKNSPALEDINEQFRKFAPKIHIVSFYETLDTAVGPKKVRILEKESAILGYPHEISTAMNADHHDVCKYYSPRDANYVSMRNALKTLMDRICEMGITFRRFSSSSSNASEAVEALLSIQDQPEDDYNFFHDQWMPGTCHWILEEKAFQTWMKDTTQSSILWLHALPATGKSVLSSFIINYIKMRDQYCQYYFFRFGEETKRSINGCLRSIAFQLSQDIPQFRKRMRDLAEDGLRLEKTDARTVWTRLFVSSLLSLRQTAPLYWVVDALDEADSPKLFLDLLTSLHKSGIPIKLLVVSRELSGLSFGFSQLGKSVPVDILPITSESLGDVRAYVEGQMRLPKWDANFKEEVATMILLRARGNFLWVYLAVKEVLKRHTSDDIWQALESIPIGMEAMYHRMALEVARDMSPTDKQLARRILIWVIFSRRALTLRELEEALRPSFNKILDLRSTITATCGFFVVVDMNENVTMIHQTARDYLTLTPDLELSIDHENAHLELFHHCMTCLMDTGLRSKLHQPSAELKRDFIQYAATSWSHHLEHATRINPEAIATLVQFLRKSHVLTWIRILASSRQLKAIVYASRTLSELANSKKSSRLKASLEDDQEELLRSWAIDLVKIVGKFGSTLLYDPASIHNFIPEFCPQTSMICQQFSKQRPLRLISVSGITNKKWDDSVAHMSVRRYRLTKLLCSRGHVAAAATDHRSHGVTLIWSSTNFEKRLSLVQGEYITACSFDATGTRYISCGVSQTKIWEIPSGRLVLTARSPRNTTVLGVTFSEDKTTVMAAAEDKSIQLLALDSCEPEWQSLNSLQEPNTPKLGNANSPSAMVFSPDGTQIAVAYRGFPLAVWGLEDCEPIARCSRQVEDRGFDEAVWPGVDAVSWNARYNNILGRYSDGCVFKWDPYEQTSDELRTPANLVQCSPDGLSFATCDNNGVIRLFNYQNFALLYQLQCDASPRAFAFSPDARRFYEIRDTVCTAWEPPSLTDLQETGDQSKAMWETQSDISTLNEPIQVVKQEDRVTSIAIAQGGKFFCTGNEVGEVYLLDAAGNRILKLWSSPRFMMIELLAWDNSGKRLIIAELGGAVSVKLLSPPSATSNITHWEVQSLLDLKMSSQLGTAQQLLFSPDGSQLLLVRQKGIQAFSLEERTVSSQYHKSDEVGQHWMNDPSDSQSLLAFSNEQVRRFSWATLEGARPLRYSDEAGKNLAAPTLHWAAASSDEAEDKCSAQSDAIAESRYLDVIAYLAQDRAHIMVERKMKAGLQSILIFKVSDLHLVPQLPDRAPATPPALSTAIRVVPEEVMKLVEVSLGVLPKDRFVFLDQDFWICTWKIGSTYTKAEPSGNSAALPLTRAHSAEKAGTVKKHFMLPRHWLNQESLPLLRLVESGRIFCPKGDEVAVISTRLGLAY